MKLFALSDLHLSFGTPRKGMDVFGPHWVDHADRIAEAWCERVGPDDLVLSPGDFSWAMRMTDALPDIEYLAALPGRKVLCRGNHDYWWSSAAKVRAALPEGIHIVHRDAIRIGDVALAGTRLWDDREMGPVGLAQRAAPGADDGEDARRPKTLPRKKTDPEEDERIFLRELSRLDMALGKMDASAALRVVLVHYPPIAADLEPTRTSIRIRDAGADLCVFGHLHNYAPRPGRSLLGVSDGVAYHLASCDYLDFIPSLVGEV